MGYGTDPEFNPYGAPDHFEEPQQEEGPEERPVVFARDLDRFCAWLIDWVVLMVLIVLGAVALVPIIGAINGGQMPGPEDRTVPFLLVPLFYLAPVVYFALMESSSWQASLGKKAVGIKVVNRHGRPISLGQALGRNLVKILSLMICSLPIFLIIAFDGRKRGLHDMIAGTLVVKA